ncbi:F-box protein [Aspergillus stella-maris]|uniref:F-box protein n=1 Tax=Aspergillus stella-maris TaxID=1810926 RepID=UPI003CCCBD89
MFTLCQAFENRISAFARTLFSTNDPEDAPVLDLPEPIFQRIFNLLSPVDQICLSLTCKRYRPLGGSIIRHEQFHFPRLYSKKARPTFKLEPSQPAPRTELLLRLEDCHFAYCSACLMLHPNREFTPFSSLNINPLERQCMPYAGIVDLCPCMSLTSRDQTKLLQWLDKATPENPSPIKSAHLPAVMGLLKPMFVNLAVDDWVIKGLVHKCLVLDKPGLKVEHVLTLHTHDRSRRLIALSGYTVRTSATHDLSDIDSVYPCPHEGLLRFVQSGLKAEDRPCGIRLLCPETHLDRKCDIRTIKVVVHRPLASREWLADNGWLKLCRPMPFH